VGTAALGRPAERSEASEQDSYQGMPSGMP